MRRRFFKRLEQGIEARRRQHVHLVDEIHLVASARWRVLHIVEQLAGVLDLRARGSIHFDQIDEATFGNLHAARTYAARLRANALFAVQTARQDPGDRCLADASRPGEQICVVKAVGFKGVDKRAQHMFLTHHRRETIRAPFPREYFVSHTGCPSGAVRPMLLTGLYAARFPGVMTPPDSTLKRDHPCCPAQTSCSSHIEAQAQNSPRTRGQHSRAQSRWVQMA